MNVKEFVKILDCDFYTGVPDSQLKALCNYLVNTYGISKKHMIAANEGNAVGLAAGHYLSTGKIPMVYMQNSGIGNIINPVASLINDEVYGIPCIFVVGWRGEPGVHDEPQHVYQGKVTLQLLEDMDIETCVVSKNTTAADIEATAEKFSEKLKKGKSVAYVVKKGALTYDETVIYKNNFPLKREKILEYIADYAKEDIIVSTTGKASRELFEIRERRGQNHSHDFLTVGSMGHSSSIALKIALEHPEKRVWCIDGDGAVLMHMGSMALIGKNHPSNFVHVLINNEAHETVGGMPTVAGEIDFTMIASGCGYDYVNSVRVEEELKRILKTICEKGGLSFVEIKSGIGARDDLGRPTTTPEENKNAFMDFVRK